MIYSVRTGSDLSASVGLFVRTQATLADPLAELLEVNTSPGTPSLGVLVRVYTLGAVQWGEVVAGQDFVQVVAGAAFGAQKLLTNDALGRAVIATAGESVGAYSIQAALGAASLAYAQTFSSGGSAGAGGGGGGPLLFGANGNPAVTKVRTGDRPAAASVPLGTTWLPRDDRVSWVTAPKIADPDVAIWIPSSSPSARSVAAVVAGAAAAVAQHLGVYDPVAGTWTQATVAGQLCNSVAGTAGIVGASIFVVYYPATCAQAAGWGGQMGDELMTDATGFGIPYVNNGTNVALGVAITPNTVTGPLVGLFYEY